MKGFNVKKLAAIATGVALLGSAIAPIVSATNVTKDDIFRSNGSPSVNIVIGSEAALSDAVWAGNLAAKIAEKAATSNSVSVSATGEDGGSVAELDLSDLTIDVTVGGTVSFGAGSTSYKRNLVSSGTNAELINNNDTNALTDSRLSHLFNSSVQQKIGGVTSTASIKERIGLYIDAKFDKVKSHDLIAKIEGGKFYYEVQLGASGLDLNTTSFTDGTTDNVKVIFFGETYELSQANLGSSPKNIRLVKSSAKEAYNEGETIEGLVGDGEFSGEQVTVKVVQIIQTGAATTSYQGTFELYDAEGNLIDTQTLASSGTPNLREYFQDSEGDEALKSNLFINTVAVGATTGIGYVEITKGTDTLELYDTKGYPYDATDTSGSYDYQVAITTDSTNKILQRIKISNSVEKWGDKNPLYPERDGVSQSLQGNEGNVAIFGGSFADGILGKGYAKVEFLGFEANEEKTVIEIGNAVTGLDATAIGGISYKGSDDTQHNIPLALELDNMEAPASTTFLFDTKTIAYDLNYGDNTGASNLGDLNIHVVTGDIVNGRTWTITNPQVKIGAGNGALDGNVTISVGGVGFIIGDTTSDQNVIATDSFVIDNVTYTLMDNNVVSTINDVMVAVDGVANFWKTQKNGTFQYNSSTQNSNIAATDATNGKLYFSEGQVFDSNSATIGANPTSLMLEGNNDRDFYYSFMATSTLGQAWLLLKADRLGADESSIIQNSKTIDFLGTAYLSNGNTTETKGIPNHFWDGNMLSSTVTTGTSTSTTTVGNRINAPYFVPQASDFNDGSAFSDQGNTYFTAVFRVNDNVTGGADINVYIDTADAGNMGPFTNNNLTGWTTDVDVNGSVTLNLKSGTVANTYQAAYTDAGTKIELLDSDAGVRIVSPESLEQIEFVIYGTEVSRTVSGGDPLTLTVGEKGTTSSGTTVTVTAVNGGSCGAVGGSGGDVLCTATPSSYGTPAAVSNPIVYLDVEAPSGTNIIIGGHIVNALASSLADELTAPGQMVARVSETGDIYLAGYTAEDTGRAVQELIDDIDAMDLA